MNFMKQKFVNAASLSKLITCIIVLLSASSSKAQLSTDQNFAFGDKRKISVNLKITPSTKEFKAGITTIDSLNSKLRLWVCNAEEKRCTISIKNGEGFFWNSNFKDAYFNQVYDLSLLDDGEYRIQVNNGTESFDRKILINSQTFSVRNISIH